MKKVEDVAQVLTKFQDDVNKAFQKVDEKHGEILLESGKNAKTHTEALEAHKQTLAESMETHAKTLDDAKEAHSKALTEVREAHSKAIADSQEASRSALAEAKEVHTRLMNTQAATLRDEIKVAASEAAATASQNAEASANRVHDTLSAKVADLEAKISNLEAGLKKAREDQSALQGLKDELLQAVQKQAESLKAEMAATATATEERVGGLQRELDESKAQNAAAIEAAKSELTALISTKLEASMQDLTRRQQENQTKVDQTLQEVQQRTTDSCARNEQLVRNETAALRRELDESKAQNVALITAAKSELTGIVNSKVETALQDFARRQQENLAKLDQTLRDQTSAFDQSKAQLRADLLSEADQKSRRDYDEKLKQVFALVDEGHRIAEGHFEEAKKQYQARYQGILKTLPGVLGVSHPVAAAPVLVTEPQPKVVVTHQPQPVYQPQPIVASPPLQAPAFSFAEASPPLPQPTATAPQVDLSRTIITGEGHRRAQFNLPATFTILFYNASGSTVAVAGSDIEVFIRTPGPLVHPTVEPHDTWVKVTYTPPAYGEYEISLKYRGQALPQSPYRVNIPKEYTHINQPAKVLSKAQFPQFERPFSIAIDQISGRIFISDPDAHTIMVLNKDATAVERTIGSKGTADGKFEFPRGIAINSNGELIVADAGSSRIQVFDSSFQFKRAFGRLGNGPGEMAIPRGVAVGVENSIYVVDTDNHRIQIFDSDGNFKKSFGKQGSKSGEFTYPLGAAVSIRLKEIAVSDADNGRVQVFDLEGTFKRSIGRQGKGEGDLDKPNGVAFDTHGNIFVADMNNHRIQIFTNDGAFLGKFGTRGNRDGEFDEPRGVAVDQANTIYVADFKNKRVQIF